MISVGAVALGCRSHRTIMQRGYGKWKQTMKSHLVGFSACGKSEASRKLDVGSQVPSLLIPFLLPMLRFLVLFPTIL